MPFKALCSSRTLLSISIIGKPLPNNHEHLGAYILKNTDYENGITKILHDDGPECNLTLTEDDVNKAYAK